MAQTTQIAVLGAGPGGYAAAFYAADLGMQVTLIDEEKNPGGVCLYRGCIPSKALLHVARVAHAIRTAPAHAITGAGPLPPQDLGTVMRYVRAAQARIELATTLVALGRTDVAEQEAASALDQLLELGAEIEAERARRLQVGAVGRGDAGAPLGLTPREREVLRLIAEGLTNRQIAERLVVSEHTVHRHVTNLLRKLEMPTRAAAAALAARLGLLEDRHR